jgi:hypothetical protein
MRIRLDSDALFYVFSPDEKLIYDLYLSVKDTKASNSTREFKLVLGDFDNHDEIIKNEVVFLDQLEQEKIIIGYKLRSEAYQEPTVYAPQITEYEVLEDPLALPNFPTALFMAIGSVHFSKLEKQTKAIIEAKVRYLKDLKVHHSALVRLIKAYFEHRNFFDEKMNASYLKLADYLDALLAKGTISLLRKAYQRPFSSLLSARRDMQLKKETLEMVLAKTLAYSDEIDKVHSLFGNDHQTQVNLGEIERYLLSVDKQKLLDKLPTREPGGKFVWVIKKDLKNDYYYRGKKINISPDTDACRALDALLECANERGLVTYTDINKHMQMLGSTKVRSIDDQKLRISHSVGRGQGFLHIGRIGAGQERLKDEIGDKEIISSRHGQGYQLLNP